MSLSPAPVNSARGDALQLALLAACFVLSGAAALVYQTAWTRQFAIVFGTSELAVATVLAAYMAGLALGAALVERLLPRVQRPVLVYGVLELGIAASAALLLPALLWASRWLLVAWFGGQSAPPSSEQVATTLFYLASAFIALAVPTTLMGATLPLLARHCVRERGQIGRRVGLLYASNTAGAVLGALLTAFVLLPNLGLARSVWCGALLNVVVFALAAALARRAAAGSPPAPPAAGEAVPQRGAFTWTWPPAPIWVLPLMLASGAVSFTHEVLWTRMLANVVGSSIYAFGVMVGSFLAGIALGGAAGAWLARERERSLMALAVAQLAAAACAALAYLLLERLVPAHAGLMANLAFGFLLLLPLTFAIGLTYPLAVRVLADRAADAAPAAARVYAWNTVGGIIGALAAGFFVIPALRFEGTIRLAVALSALLALLYLLLPGRRRPWVLAVTAAASLAGVLAFRPAMPEKLLLTSPLNVGAYGRIVYYDVGRSASVVMLQQDGGFALRTNGLPEALMDSPGMSPRFSGEFWLSSLPVIARPDTADMLIVGFGGGVVVEGVPPSVRHVDVIELEPKVIAANTAIRARRKFDPLGDPRVNLVGNDARGALALTGRRYDAIVSQPSHPWTAGASHLYTREFMALAREHLRPDGVFVQWMNVAFLDEALLRSLTATLLEVFGQVRIYRPDPATLVFLAAREPLALEQRVAASGLPLALAPAHYARFGINCAEDLIAALAVDEDGARRLADGAELITDDNNRMATSSVFELGRGLGNEAAGRVLAEFDPLVTGAPWLYAGLAGRFDPGYVARRQLFFRSLDASVPDRVAALARNLGESSAARYVRVLLLASRGDVAGAVQLARESLVAYPGAASLAYASLQPSLGAIARGVVDASQQAAIAALPRSGQAAIRGAQLLVQGQFAQLAELDPLLAEAAWTDAWYFDALQLRSEWRSRVSNPELARRYSDQAIGFADRATFIQPSLALFAVRARAAINADRPDVLLESVASVVQWTVAGASGASPQSRARARSTLQEVRGLLSGRDADPRIDRPRLEEVRARVDEAIASLN